MGAARSLEVHALDRQQLSMSSKMATASFWERLSNLPEYFPDACAGLNVGHLRVVISLLKLGNLTDRTGGIRRLTDQELGWLCGVADTNIAAIRIRITDVFKTLMRALDELRGTAENKMSIETQSKWHDLLLKSLKSLVGNETWSLNNSDPKTFKFIRQRAVVQLQYIARNGEETIYPRIRGAFGKLRVPPKAKHRLDDNGIIPYHKTLATPLHRRIGQIDPFPGELEFLIILQYLALLVDPYFQAKAQALAISNNGGDWESCWRAPPTKTWVRMAAKMANPDDHGREAVPKAAANIDMSRCALTFKEPKDLENAFNECCALHEFDVLRVKNNFAESFKAETESFGYRSIMANLLYKLPKTWKQLVAEDDSGFLPQVFRLGAVVNTDDEGHTGTLLGFDAKRDVVSVMPVKLLQGPATLSSTSLIQLNKQMVNKKLDDWLKKLPESLKSIANIDQLATRMQFTVFLNKALLSVQANFIVEIQFLLADYLRMRKKSHIWYGWLCKHRFVGSKIENMLYWCQVQIVSHGQPARLEKGLLRVRRCSWAQVELYYRSAPQ